MSKLKNIVVVAYDPAWPGMYASEAEKIARVFGKFLISIEHVGSTSIPNLPAKPIIDIMLVVEDIEMVESLNPAMIELGYEPKGEYGISGRRHFSKGGDRIRTHNIHTYASGNPEIERHRNFRDYLIAHAHKARQYAEMKAHLAQEFPHDMDSYLAGKAVFIKEILAKAAIWREEVEGK